MTPAAPPRWPLLVAGALVLAVVWGAPLGAWLPGPFSAHMTMHMGVVAVAAPLLALGVAGSRFDPVRRKPRWFAPVPASLVELLVVWGWHTPLLHHAARGSTAGLVAEQATFLVSGLVVWLASVAGSARSGGARTAAGIVALLLTSMHMTLLGALLALPQRLLFDHGAHHGHGHGGPADAAALLADQQLGGAIMLIAGGVVYLAGGLALAAALLRVRWSAAPAGRGSPAPGPLGPGVSP